MNIEKKPHESKKFVAWLINQLLLTALATTALIAQDELGWPLAVFMTLIVLTMGLSTMWMIGRQAACDIAVRGYALFGNKEKKDG